MQSVETTCVLREQAAPQDWHRENKRIEARIIESFAEIAAGSWQHGLLAIQNLLQRAICFLLRPFLANFHSQSAKYNR
jgi:hypothetical protein